MKNAIVIKVRETDESTAIGIQTDVSLTERTKYVILLNLMKSLEMSIDWMNAEQIEAFSLKMLLASLGNVTVEAHED
nr:MAG TPA: hypothetical protein [Caudoviricetes sp.]